MAEYQKIQTLFKRDEKNIIIPSIFTLPEFEYLKDCKWEATEKIDGTNMRVELLPTFNEDGTLKKVLWEFKGRTDKAQIPPHLMEKMYKLTMTGLSIISIQKARTMQQSLSMVKAMARKFRREATTSRTTWTSSSLMSG